MRLLAIVAALAASTAGAQELAALDPRIVAMQVDEGMLRLPTAPDVTQTLLFRPGERIASVILSDPAAFFVTVTGTGDSLTLRATHASAYGGMSVRTNAHSYEFALTAASAQSVPAVVRLVDRPAQVELGAQPASPIDTGERHSYRLTGSKALKPTSISDDGAKTYIEWAGDQALPATFALGPTGAEQMVDGYMRGQIYTIDRVYETLIFRIDKERARAIRSDKADNTDSDNGGDHG